MPDSMKKQIASHLQTVEAAIANVAVLADIADRITDCFENGGKLFLLGNGGSAADAQHIAAELVGRFKKDRKALPAIALTTDTSALTAIANDLGAENCFSRQIEALVTPKDIVWALSVSGKSPNVIRAVEAARKIGVPIVGFTSRTGDALASKCDLCFRGDHTDSDRVQEVHQLAYHLICDRIERKFH